MANGIRDLLLLGWWSPQRLTFAAAASEFDILIDCLLVQTLLNFKTSWKITFRGNNLLFSRIICYYLKFPFIWAWRSNNSYHRRFCERKILLQGIGSLQFIILVFAIYWVANFDLIVWQKAFWSWQWLKNIFSLQKVNGLKNHFCKNMFSFPKYFLAGTGSPLFSSPGLWRSNLIRATQHRPRMAKEEFFWEPHSLCLSAECLLSSRHSSLNIIMSHVAWLHLTSLFHLPLADVLASYQE